MKINLKYFIDLHCCKLLKSKEVLWIRVALSLSFYFQKVKQNFPFPKRKERKVKKLSFLFFVLKRRQLDFLCCFKEKKI
jgi:hypothetical protein